MELVIAVAIIGILTSIALPSYNSSVVRASREAVKTELLQMAALQEKIYLNSNAYSTSLTSAYSGQAAGGLGWSANSKDKKYTFSCTCTATTYTILATPVVGRGQANANDGTVQIDQIGNRLWNKTTPATPW